MGNGDWFVTDDEFDAFSTDQKLKLIYNTVNHRCAARHTDCIAKMVKIESDHMSRIEKLENRKLFDKGLSAFMGLVGGMIAVFFKKIFGI